MTGALRRSSEDAKRSTGRADWSTWPAYDGAACGLENHWYPVLWSTEVAGSPVARRICGHNIVLLRGPDGTAYALHDRCLHRGVRLSQGTQHFGGTVSCPYHGWTYRLSDGELVAVITDGPDSPMCGKAAVRTYPTAEALGLVWVFVGDAEPHPLTEQLPEELADHTRRSCSGGSTPLESRSSKMARCPWRRLRQPSRRRCSQPWVNRRVFGARNAMRALTLAQEASDHEGWPPGTRNGLHTMNAMPSMCRTLLFAMAWEADDAL